MTVIADLPDCERRRVAVFHHAPSYEMLNVRGPIDEAAMRVALLPTR
jgi:hypothetical protein